MSYQYMEDAVDELCRSIEMEPNRWCDTTRTLDDCKTGIEYWKNEGAITHIWTGHAREQVFSDMQGARIYKSYQKLREYKASVSQQKVLNAMQPSEKQKHQVKEVADALGYDPDTTSLFDRVIKWLSS